jgi:hypothetical protein
MGRAEQLFDRIRIGGAAEIAGMIATPVVEELFLDYKQSSTILPARKLSDEDRRNLAKAVSGFGNSEGGVIVWGVDCRSTPSGDVPTGPVPIKNPVALKTLFDGAVGGLILPAHQAVENLSILNDGATDGFVLTHIPAGFNVPYQTLGDREEYYIRAGSNFLPAPHGVLAGMFGRRPQPEVKPIIRLDEAKSTPQEGTVSLVFEVSVLNAGRALAEDIFVWWI